MATGEPTGLGIRVADTNMQKVFSSTATAGHEEGEEEEEEAMHLKNSMTSPEPSTSQIPVQIEQSPPHNSHPTTPEVPLSRHDQRGRKKGNFLNKIRDWSRRDRKTKPRISD